MRQRPALERFLEKIEITDGCWGWTGCQDRGYSVFWTGTRNIRAHRWLYERWKRSVPEGRYLDHLCRNRGCVNPDHLEIVTNQENILRGIGHTAQNARKTYCKRGHLLAGDNLYLTSEGWRRCKRCKRLSYLGKL
jgi:hypothetical protein